MKKIAVFVCVALICGQCWAIDKNERKMEDSLARGYLAAGKNQLSEALGYFKSAATYADKSKNWRGLVDCANAHAVLGQPKESLRLLKRATDVSRSNKDWRGTVAAGYAYLALPQDLGAKDRADDCFALGCDIALKNADWAGALEGVTGLMESGETEAAKTYLASARKIIDDIKSSEGYEEISLIYKKLGDSAAASESFDLSKKYRSINIKAATPPPGWQPAGETIAGPQRVSDEAQLAMKYAADAEIEQKTRWMIEREKREQQSQVYAYSYNRYYTYPYYYGFYGYGYPYTRSQICGWAAFNLSYYDMDDDGYYAYMGWY